MWIWYKYLLSVVFDYQFPLYILQELHIDDSLWLGFLTCNERVFRVSLNSFMYNNICSESMNLNVKDAFLFVLFCQVIESNQTRHCRISKYSFVYEVQFLIACFL